MALILVRACLEETWVTLTYNEATGRYEGILNPTGTSAHQPGGYFPITVEATNENGETTTADGSNIRALRLVVRETVSPVLTLVSPPAGYVTTSTPTIVMDVVDEPDGSGIDTGSFLALVDGGTGQKPSYSSIENGYRLSFTPTLADGVHTVTFSAADRDGNPATASVAYTIDTVPPELFIEPIERCVVDVDRVQVTAYASDVTSPDLTVRVVNNGSTVQTLGVPGPFIFSVPLDIGENFIKVIARDAAGLETTIDVYMIRMITDREEADLEEARALLEKAENGTLNEEEREQFNHAILRGSYNATDVNRVGIAVQYLKGEMTRRGYAPALYPKWDWTSSGKPKESDMRTYLNNVEQLRKQVPVTAPETPPDMNGLTLSRANDIETILVAVDEILLRTENWVCGEIVCGEI